MTSQGTHPGPSTSSLLSTDTSTSTTPLSPGNKPPQKDYAAAFATLQSRYGTVSAGGLSPPDPKSTPSKKLPALAGPSSSNSAQPAGSSQESATLTISSTESKEGKSKEKSSLLRKIFKSRTFSLET
ncbi:hypothetical protein C8J56DRAFT_1156559 [Mycena floridula]|nr:hypothetical protein C8J56DRAFT_1156559 [Mycena floridula]